MPPPGFMLGPEKGGSKTNRRGRQTAELASGRRTRVTPSDTPSPTTSVSQHHFNRKRPGDGVVGENASNKRRKVDGDTQSPSPLASNRGGFTGPPPGRPFIDLTADTPQRKAPQAPRYKTPLSRSTPTPSAKGEPNVIDLTLSDDESDDDSCAPPSTPLQKTTQSGATEYHFGLANPQTPVASRGLLDLSPQRPESKHGLARPTSSVPAKGATLLTPAQDRMRPAFITAFQPGQLTDGSPGASKDMTAPPKFAPAQVTKEVVLANRSMLAVRDRQADQDRLRRVFDPVPRGVVRDRDHDTRKIDDKTKNGHNKSAVNKRVDTGGPIVIESDDDPDETEDLSQTGRSKESRMLQRSATVGTSQPQEPPGSTLIGQAQKQSELVGDGRSDGGDERAGRGSTSLRLDIGRKTGPNVKQPPSTPRKTRIVVLKGLPPHKLRRITQRPVQRPDIPMSTCFLILLAPEIQDNIFKYLLLAEDPIQVLHRWSKLYQRQRSGLYPAILSTCSVIFRNASAFLYSQNVFRYLVRDRTQSGAFPSFGQEIYVEKYMPLFRKLELQIERSRTEHAYCTSLASAIRLLNDHGADLHTLAMDVSPSVEGDTLSTVGYFYQNGEIIQALKALKTCFITVRVFTPETEDEPATSLRRVLDMRTEPGVFDHGPRPPPDLQLDDLCEMITLACECPSEVVEQGLFEEFEVIQRQNERRARSSRIAYSFFDADDDDDIESEDNDDGDYSDFEG